MPHRTRWVALRYTVGHGAAEYEVGPDLVTTRDNETFTLPFTVRSYPLHPEKFTILREYPKERSGMRILRDFVRDFPPEVAAPYRSSGWIRPNGEFYPGMHGHATLAQYLTTLLWGGPVGEPMLEDHDWLRLHYTGQPTPPKASFKFVTVEQLDTIKALMDASDDEDWREHLEQFTRSVRRAHKLYGERRAEIEPGLRSRVA